MGSIEKIDLVQDITTDCSVVASLCAGTARALKGHGQVSLRLSQTRLGINIIKLSFHSYFLQ